MQRDGWCRGMGDADGLGRGTGVQRDGGCRGTGVQRDGGLQREGGVVGSVLGRGRCLVHGRRGHTSSSALQTVLCHDKFVPSPSG